MQHKRRAVDGCTPSSYPLPQLTNFPAPAAAEQPEKERCGSGQQPLAQPQRDRGGFGGKQIYVFPRRLCARVDDPSTRESGLHVTCRPLLAVGGRQVAAPTLYWRERPPPSKAKKPSQSACADSSPSGRAFSCCGTGGKLPPLRCAGRSVLCCRIRLFRRKRRAVHPEPHALLI